MPHLSGRAHDTLQRIRAIARDSSRPELLAERTLAALDRAIPFDEGAVFGVDPGSLLFDRVLAYRGPGAAGYAVWLRDVYLVAGEVGALHVPTLLRHGGAVAMHERADRWLRSPPPASGPVLSRAWRDWESPLGGVLRYGLRVRDRWVGLIQMARLDPGDGFRAAELELLDRVAPAVSRSLSESLAGSSAGSSVGSSAGHSDAAVPAEPPPSPGSLIFDADRRLVVLSSSAQTWLTGLPDDASRVLGQVAAPGVPVGVQSVVGSLAGSSADVSRATLRTHDGVRVSVRGERAVRIGADGSAAVGYSVTLGPAPALPPETSPGQWRIAEGVAEGLSDREIANRLHLSVHTVHERVATLHELCGTRTRPQLVAALAGVREG